MQNITFRRCKTRNNYECGFSLALYACTVPQAPFSITLEDCESVGDRMGAFVASSFGPNTTGTARLLNCKATAGAGPGLMIRGKSSAKSRLLVENLQLLNTATKQWIAGGEELRFPVSISPNGAKIGVQVSPGAHLQH